MADIKVKDIAKKSIKAIDKSAIATERFKDTIVHTKQKAENTYSDNGNIYQDGSDKIQFITNRAVDETAHNFNKYGKKAFVETKKNIKKSTLKIKAFKENKLAEKNIKGAKGVKGVAKNTKTTIKTSKEVAKNAKKVAQQSVKASQRAVR